MHAEIPWTSIRFLNDRRIVVLLMFAFFVSLLPFVATFTKHHPDERHYTDAAMQMVKSGDYLQPLTPTGELRLKKPILTYWLVAAGYRWIEISPLTSRLPFLILGTVVVGLTYCFAKQIFGSSKVAILACCAVALQPSLVISSMRSIPDVVLTVCLLVSAIGFARLYAQKNHAWLSIACAYLGLALAVESKGSPAVVFGLIAIGILLWYRFDSVKQYLMRHVVGISICAVLASSWFLYMLYLNPSQLLLQFFGDQVGENRLDGNPLKIIVDLCIVLGLLAFCCLPWILAIGEYFQRHVSNALSGKPSVSSLVQYFAHLHPSKLLMIAWTAVYLVLAACVDRINVRYQCPIAPFIACFIGYAVASLPVLRLQLWTNVLAKTVSAALACFATAIGMIAFLSGDMNSALAISLPPIIALAVVIWWTMRQAMFWRGAVTIATVTVLASVPIAYMTFETLGHNRFETEVLTAFKRLAPAGAKLSVMTVSAHGSRLRVAAQNNIDIEFHGQATEQLRSHRGAISYDVMMMGGWEPLAVDLSEYNLTYVRDGYIPMTMFDFLKSAWSGKGPDYLKEHEQYVVLAIRKPEIIAARTTNSSPRRISVRPAVYQRSVQ